MELNTKSDKNSDFNLNPGNIEIKKFAFQRQDSSLLSVSKKNKGLQIMDSLKNLT